MPADEEMAKQPLVVAVVLTWNDVEMTGRCVESVLASDYRPLRVLLVDNGSETPCGEEIQARFPSIELLVLPENQGFTGGSNRGIGRALLTAKRDPSPIAVLYSQRSLHAAGTRRWQENVTGLCETIKDLGLQFDFVADEQVADGVLAERPYKVLFLPLALALADEEVAAIKRFAQRGGRVIAVGEAGVFNRFGRTREKGALDDLFGVTTPTTKPPVSRLPSEILPVGLQNQVHRRTARPMIPFRSGCSAGVLRSSLMFRSLSQ